jgi:hypothetical protein
MTGMGKTLLRYPLICAAVLSVVLMLGGCQAIFTYSPVSALQRDPSSLTAAERLTYGENALASGDKATMKAAYNAIKNDTGVASQYLAAQLGIEASGVPGLILTAVTDMLTTGSSDFSGGGSSVVTDFLAANPGVDPSYLIAAAGNLGNVPSASLTTMDSVYGGLGMALDAAQQPDGSFNFAAADPVKMAAAQTFVNDATVSADSTLSASDPVRQFLDMYNTYIAGL